MVPSCQTKSLEHPRNNKPWRNASPVAPFRWGRQARGKDATHAILGNAVTTSQESKLEILSKTIFTLNMNSFPHARPGIICISFASTRVLISSLFKARPLYMTLHLAVKQELNSLYDTRCSFFCAWFQGNKLSRSLQRHSIRILES